MYIMLYVLFAVSQTGIAMHEVTHINPDTSQSQSDDEDQNAAEEHCDRCISQADTDTADLPQAFTVPSKTLQSILATFYYRLAISLQALSAISMI